MSGLGKCVQNNLILIYSFLFKIANFPTKEVKNKAPKCSKAQPLNEMLSFKRKEKTKTNKMDQNPQLFSKIKGHYNQKRNAQRKLRLIKISILKTRSLRKLSGLFRIRTETLYQILFIKLLLLCLKRIDPGR